MEDDMIDISRINNYDQERAEIKAIKMLFEKLLGKREFLIDANEATAREKYQELLEKIGSIDTTDVYNALEYLPFFVEGETTFGKKEHYNDINVRFANATKKVSLLTAPTLMLALISSICVMSEQIFEHYMALFDDFKLILANNKNEFFDLSEEDKFIVAFAVSIACDKKVLLKEKYEEFVEQLLA